MKRDDGWQVWRISTKFEVLCISRSRRKRKRARVLIPSRIGEKSIAVGECVDRWSNVAETPYDAAWCVGRDGGAEELFTEEPREELCLGGHSPRDTRRRGPCPLRARSGRGLGGVGARSGRGLVGVAERRHPLVKDVEDDGIHGIGRGIRVPLHGGQRKRRSVRVEARLVEPPEEARARQCAESS